MDDLYQHLKSEQGKEIIKTGWRAAGITDILKDARMGNGNTVRPNPFVWYKQVYVSYIIIKKFPQIDVKFACFFVYFLLHRIWMYFSEKKFWWNWKFALIRYHLNIWISLIRVNYHSFWNSISLFALICDGIDLLRFIWCAALFSYNIVLI